MKTKKTRKQKIKKPTNTAKVKKASEPKVVHPWRLCPLGEHWVKIHPRNTPKGEVTTVTGHCRANPSKKDQIYAHELDEISKKFFNDLKIYPTPNNLGFKNGNDFDALIAGWTQYWSR